MADDHQPQVPLLRLVQQEGPDLGLGDEVQHGADLVAQQIAHSGPQGTGDAEPLELPAGEGADALVEQSLPMDPGQAALHPLPQVGGDGEEQCVLTSILTPEN